MNWLNRLASFEIFDPFWFNIGHFTFFKFMDPVQIVPMGTHHFLQRLPDHNNWSIFRAAFMLLELFRTTMEGWMVDSRMICNYCVLQVSQIGTDSSTFISSDGRLRGPAESIQANCCNYDRVMLFVKFFECGFCPGNARSFGFREFCQIDAFHSLQSMKATRSFSGTDAIADSRIFECIRWTYYHLFLSLDSSSPRYAFRSFMVRCFAHLSGKEVDVKNIRGNILFHRSRIFPPYPACLFITSTS